jgi:ketosteroid isomerase-like protein
MNARELANQAIEEMVHRETRAWDQQDAETLVDLFHPDMVWPWPPTAKDHDPESWVLEFGRYHRSRWKDNWEKLFATHRLVHNHREIRKVVASAEGDGGFAVVDIDTLWRGEQGCDAHWMGRVCKVYTRMDDGRWKLIMHTGVLAY